MRRRDLAPLVLSVCDRYRPTVEEFLRHVAELRERSRWDESVVLGRIDRIAAVDGGFEVGGHGVFRHVLVATGTPASRCRTSSRATRASSTPTSRTSTPRASPSSARAWPPRPSG